jgi:ubiquinone/menaquinone biosynthesis C-methylase UbiE
MSSNALYTDLSGYYDLMCADIDYQAQSHAVHRLHQIFGNGPGTYLDLACGTGPHVRHFIDFGYQCYGLDINQPMLDIAVQRCPQAQFTVQNMSDFKVDEPLDLISCFLYSIHYCDGIQRLKDCLVSVHNALKPGGVFCFNAVDKNKIDNNSSTTHSVEHDNSHFVFGSGWHYSGDGDKQSLKVSIEKTTGHETQLWQDEHAMVALSFKQLQALLAPYFQIDIFEHDYDKIVPWDKHAGNAIFVCVKI